MQPEELRTVLAQTLADLMTRPGPTRTVEETPHWTRVTDQTRHAMLNTVLRARLDPGAAGAAIEEMIGHYGERELPFIWLVDGATEPPDLAGRLLARGFAEGEAVAWLAASVAAALETLPEPAGVAVEEVDRPNFDEYLAVSRALGLDWPDDPWGRFEQRRAAGSRLFIARVDGQAVAFAGHRVTRGVLLLAGAATLPGARGKGAYKALLRRRLLEGQAAGLEWACIHSSPFSAPIVARHGFREYDRSMTYVWDPYGTGTGRHQ